MSSSMETEGPLQSALLAQARRQTHTDKIISDDQIRQLLIFMGTITIISFVLVIALVTIFIFFIWYSRTRLHRPCGCTHSHDKQRHPETRTSGDRSVQPQPMSSPRSGPNLGQPVKMLVVGPGQFQSRSHKNVIVNPLPCGVSDPSPQNTVVTASTDTRLGINQSHPHTDGQTDGQSYSGQELLSGEDWTDTEPIYAEILPKLETEKETGEEVILNIEENASKINKILECEDDEEERSVNSCGKKKEIEYWQITAKEVVKFRPCTETFIQRE